MLELRGNHQRQVICKDSLNFFHCALSALPATFGLNDVADKPFFAYHYIHEANLDVELPAGALPPRSDYDPDRMRTEQRASFLDWYARELVRPGRQPYILRRELLRYCWNGNVKWGGGHRGVEKIHFFAKTPQFFQMYAFCAPLVCAFVSWWPSVRMGLNPFWPAPQ